MSFFTTEHTAIYFGMQAQYFSNGGFIDSNHNNSLNTARGDSVRRLLVQGLKRALLSALTFVHQKRLA
jgi:hypothetical protein